MHGIGNLDASSGTRPRALAAAFRQGLRCRLERGSGRQRSLAFKKNAGKNAHENRKKALALMLTNDRRHHHQHQHHQRHHRRHHHHHHHHHDHIHGHRDHHHHPHEHPKQHHFAVIIVAIVVILLSSSAAKQQWPTTTITPAIAQLVNKNRQGVVRIRSQCKEYPQRLNPKPQGSVRASCVPKNIMKMPYLQLSQKLLLQGFTPSFSIE